jgi:ribosomal protein S18 acetylase RimI-like enzyme
MDLIVKEFDKEKHMIFAETIMGLDEELSEANACFNPAEFVDEPSLGNITYPEYIDLLLDGHWRLFIILLDDKCIGYAHVCPGKYKGSVYIGSFVIKHEYCSNGYGSEAMNQLQDILKKDYSLITLNVAIENKKAVTLYTKAGFEPKFYAMFKRL